MTEEEMRRLVEYKIWTALYTRELSRLVRESKEPFVYEPPYYPEEH